MNDAAPATIGHNQIPLTRPEDLAETLDKLYADVFARVDRILERRDAADKAIESDEQDAKVTAFVTQQVMALIEECETLHAKEKKPYLDAGRIVDRTLLDRQRSLEDIKRICERRSTQYKFAKAEKERLAREAEAAAARKTAEETGSPVAHRYAEAAEAAAQAPVADLTRTRSPLGGASALRTVWKYRVVDAAKVPKKFLSVDDAKIKQAMRAAGDDIKNLKIAGVEIFEDASTKFRR